MYTSHKQNDYDWIIHAKYVLQVAIHQETGPFTLWVTCIGQQLRAQPY